MFLTVTGMFILKRMYKPGKYVTVYVTADLPVMTWARCEGLSVSLS